jgi:hypothetical protein
MTPEPPTDLSKDSARIAQKLTRSGVIKGEFHAKNNLGEPFGESTAANYQRALAKNPTARTHSPEEVRQHQATARSVMFPARGKTHGVGKQFNTLVQGELF